MKKDVKGKKLYWVLLVIFIIVSCILIYFVIDQAVTITYMMEGYKETSENLETLINLIPRISKKLSRDELTHIIKDIYPDKFLFKEEKIHIDNLTFEFDEQGIFRLCQV